MLEETERKKTKDDTFESHSNFADVVLQGSIWRDTDGHERKSLSVRSVRNLRDGHVFANVKFIYARLRLELSLDLVTLPLYACKPRDDRSTNKCVLHLAEH